MEREELITYWTASSDKDHATMMRLFQGGDYSWALFLGHLVMEKLLKALYVKIRDSNYPLTHNLLRLAEQCGLDLTEEQQDFYATVTSFNINARYDDYKLNFYKRCTKSFSEKWIIKINRERSWIKQMLSE
ncbi:MAG: HEPN domain-containing protein [Bacteroidales bacterium]|nr:HEPN domain-containing protein [Bacteroidales bacterium]